MERTIKKHCGFQDESDCSMRMAATAALTERIMIGWKHLAI